MAIQIGKYKRPGIFIEEFDNSIITSPTVIGTTTFVAGFSRKGPINTPVLVTNIGDLERIYGPLDRNLERKGSFLHRTVAKLLESTPVYVMNLLATSDTLDKIEYKSVSTRSDKTNDIVREGAYRRFFDTTGFWKKDTEAFIDNVTNDPGDDDRLLHFTNMSDKYITIFAFRTRVSGYNRPLLDFYGTAEKVPPYVNQLDWASEYMIDLVVVGGDWTNYSQLNIDPRWGQYFTTTGIDKTKIRDFVNDRGVNLLAYYEGVSLIPFFRDLNGRNIFIETIVNKDTDKTGLFCAYNMDKFETDYPSLMVDLIGNNLLTTDGIIDQGQTSVDFLSYNVSLIEFNGYQSNSLDFPGGLDGQNVFSIGPSSSLLRGSQWGDIRRTTYFAEEYIDGLGLSSFATSSTSIDFGYLVDNSSSPIGSLTSSNPYFITSGNKVLINGGVSASTTFTFSIPSSQYISATTSATYISTAYLNASTGDIELVNGFANGIAPSPPSGSDLVLTYFTFSVANGSFVTGSIYKNDVCVDSVGYKELALTNDYTITSTTPGSITVKFTDTASANISPNNYEKYRRFRMFNQLLSTFDSVNLYKGTMIKDITTKEKLSTESASLTNIVTTSTSDKEFTLNLGLTATPSDILSGNLIFYKFDNELTLGQNGLETKMTLGVATGSGVVAKYSDFYQDFYNGLINTGDYFHGNLMDPSNPIRIVFQNEGTFSYVVTSIQTDIQATNVIYVPDSTLNLRSISFDSSVSASTLIDPLTGTAYSGYFAFRTDSIDLVNEDLSNVKYIWDFEKKHYLRMYLDSSEKLFVDFVESDLISPEPLKFATSTSRIQNDYQFEVWSNKRNYKQSVEIEVPTGYTQVANKILVKASRYSEVKVGDFLEAKVENVLALNEKPRNLTRIISKRLYAGDTTLVEITCDSAIEKYAIGTDLQTMRYTSIEDYVSTYVGFSLKGFRIREASMPNGTEDRQNSILNIIAKGTSLAKALTNKEAIDFRYVIDSFGLGLKENSKQQLVDLCGDRLDCFGFLNMPSMKSFKNSTSPSFVNAEGVVQTSFIATGGDPESSPAFLYTFGQGKGVSCVGYFTPYVIVNDNGRPAEVPPAMFVATTYLRKLVTNSLSILPWTIAAGVTNGRVLDIAGIEQNFTLEDIENLNQAQMNPIVFKRNRGYVIETENTAQTLYRSSLSFIHCREVLIELERELSAMLLDFQWKFNTPDVRAEIKLRADIICEKYVNKSGLYNYFNKCDEENNTNEIIDNQIGVLDTYVEVIKGMGIIVNNITVLRTGAIQAGGFINS